MEITPLKKFYIIQTPEEIEEIEHFLDPSGVMDLICDVCGSSDFWCEAIVISDVLVSDGAILEDQIMKRVMLVRPKRCQHCSGENFTRTTLED